MIGGLYWFRDLSLKLGASIPSTGHLAFMFIDIWLSLCLDSDLVSIWHFKM